MRRSWTNDDWDSYLESPPEPRYGVLMERIETISALLLIALLIGFMGYGGWWLYDCFYGDWLDAPVQGEPTPPRPLTYQVMPGDTIWSIYVTYYKGCDWDEVRYKIGQANGLKNDRLYPYEVITLPEVT